MKRILCFGDSNTYGYMPGGVGRYSMDVRWPGVLARLLGADYVVAENGLVGRTTIFREKRRPGRVGADALADCVAADKPDVIILMLGTNDCKAEFGATAQDIAEGMLRLAAIAKAKAKTLDAKIILAAPAPLDKVVLDAHIPDYNEASYSVSQQLARAYRRAAEENGYGFVNVGDYAAASPVDGEHLMPQDHAAIAKAVYREVVAL